MNHYQNCLAIVSTSMVTDGIVTESITIVNLASYWPSLRNTYADAAEAVIFKWVRPLISRVDQSQDEVTGCTDHVLGSNHFLLQPTTLASTHNVEIDKLTLASRQAMQTSTQAANGKWFVFVCFSSDSWSQQPF